MGFFQKSKFKIELREKKLTKTIYECRKIKLNVNKYLPHYFTNNAVKHFVKLIYILDETEKSISWLLKI